jgi:transketolase
MGRGARDLDIESPKATARQVRTLVVKMVANAGSGHIGGSLSAADIIAYLYFHRMRIDPEKPDWPDRDRFVLSKGHCCPALYAALALRGYFPEDVLWTLRDVESKLQGHPDMTKTPGVDMTTGSLGHGIAAAVGMALAGKLDTKDYRVYVMVGDGELQEGMVWEAAQAAAHYRLDNLIVFVDNNGFCTDGATGDIMNVEPVEAKWKAFGWNACRIDGHDFAQIDGAVERWVTAPGGRPSAIVADTVKGKGVSFMEHNCDWHSGAPTPKQTEEALRELGRGGR